jgi:hypothetical protein
MTLQKKVRRVDEPDADRKPVIGVLKQLLPKFQE